MIKRRHPRSILFILIIFLNLFSGDAIADSIPDEQWVMPIPADVRTTPYVGINADGEGINGGMGTSWLLGQESNGTIPNVSLITAHHICKSINDPACANSTIFQYAATFSKCSIELSVDCVKSVEATSALGKSLEVKFVRTLTSVGATTFAGSASLGLPSGGTAQIIDIPDAPHAGGTQYLIAAHSNGAYVVGKSKAESKSFFVRLSAIKMVPGLPVGTDIKGLYDTNEIPRPGLKFGSSIFPNDALPSSCLVYSKADDLCAAPYPLPLDINFKVTLKTSINLVGWFHGRVSKAVTTFTLDRENVATISFSGNPVIVPTYATWYKKSELPATISAYLAKQRQPLQGRSYGGDSGQSATSTNFVSILRQPHNFVQDEIDELKTWLAVSDERATASPTRWIFHSLDVVQSKPGFGGTTDNRKPLQKVDPTIACYSSNSGKFLGVVSTNATQYTAGPPSFDLTTETLDYKVAAPHFLTNGSTFQGSYNLEINESLARCIYKLSNAPISATISVIGVDGENKIATTLVNSSGGFLRLTAEGFTFSSPVIKVKLVQAGAALPNSSKESPESAQRPKTQALVSSVKTLTCVRGKSIQKVRGINPKCPAGFKRK